MSKQGIKFDEYDFWPDGDCERTYDPIVDRASGHQSGWAMRNTSNHNRPMLKKSCVGVLICSNGCVGTDGVQIAYRPSVSDKSRQRQCGKIWKHCCN